MSRQSESYFAVEVSVRKYSDCDKEREESVDQVMYIEFEVWYAGWWGNGKIVYVDNGFHKASYEWQWLVGR